ASSLGQLPPDATGGSNRSTIGQRTFEFLAGNGTGGSTVTIATSDGTTTANVTLPGRLQMQFGAPDQFTMEAPVTITQAKAIFPPMFVPGVGVLCITPSAGGSGAIDCDGGKAGGDLTLTQDHNIDDADFYCQTGCRENAPCPGLIGGPHLSVCPRCDPGTATCDSGALM